MKRAALWLIGILVVLAVALGIVYSTDAGKRWLVALFDAPYAVPDGDVVADFDLVDPAAQRIVVRLTAVGTGFDRPTDIQFVPEEPSLALIAEKGGALKWLDVLTSATGVVLEIDVISEVEMGLLGVAFHPRYADNGRLFLSYTVAGPGAGLSRVAEWRVPPGASLRGVAPKLHRTVLEIEQPWQNHNGGQVQFGPDGMLYMGWGDGGFRDDPHGNGQNRGTLLGSIIRVDVDSTDGPYAIPVGNPFVGDPTARPEIWAYGLRNPWRFSFDPAGRLIVADVGQDAHEEITIVQGGGENHGWRVREAAHCFDPPQGCVSAGMIDPIFEYGRDQGTSVTGGYVYTGSKIPALHGKYVFADFTSGRIWALGLPAQRAGQVPSSQVATLGMWPILTSTFGRDADGELYIAAFGRGVISRIDPVASR